MGMDPYILFAFKAKIQGTIYQKKVNFGQNILGSFFPENWQNFRTWLNLSDSVS